MDLAGSMTAIMSTLNPDMGKVWMGNSFAYDQAMQAAIRVLDALRPSEVVPAHTSASEAVKTMGNEIAAGVLEEAATGLTRTSGSSEIARAAKLHADLGALSLRIARFDARNPENDPGPITIRAMHGVPARLTKAVPKKGKRK